MGVGPRQAANNGAFSRLPMPRLQLPLRSGPEGPSVQRERRRRRRRGDRSRHVRHRTCERSARRGSSCRLRCCRTQRRGVEEGFGGPVSVTSIPTHGTAVGSSKRPSGWPWVRASRHRSTPRSRRVPSPTRRSSRRSPDPLPTRPSTARSPRAHSSPTAAPSSTSQGRTTS